MNKALKTLFAVGIVGVIWELMHVLTQGVGIPSILTTVTNTVDIFPLLMEHLLVSAMRLLIGLFLALLIGGVIGSLMARYKAVDELLAPLVYLVTPLPKVAFLPIMMVIFGISETARIAVLVFVVVFQFILGIRDALKSMPQTHILSMKSLALSNGSQFKDIIFPYSLPYLFTSLRQAFGMSLAVLFFLETFVNQKGIGYFIMNRWGMVNYPDMFSGILVLSIFGYLVYGFLDFLEAKLCPWNTLQNSKEKK